ncbi:hypothetical protein Bbelb_026550 [Branchiostoma belcheri]|nr:hypothetical protein Bbelb_026550 [Branchiostoma belcheri]
MRLRFSVHLALSLGHNPPYVLFVPTVTTRRTCFCVLSTCKNVGNRTASVRAYERATYGLRESNFTILTCNCCTDSARSTCVPRTLTCSMTTQNTRAPYQVLRTCNARATHQISIVYKDNLTGDCQLVSKMPREAQKKTTRQDPKKRAAEDTRAASDDEVNRRCTHLQRAMNAGIRTAHAPPGSVRSVVLSMPKTTLLEMSVRNPYAIAIRRSVNRAYAARVGTACTRQRSNRTEIVRCNHVQLTYHLRNVRCTQPLTARRVVQTTYVHLAQPCE